MKKSSIFIALLFIPLLFAIYSEDIIDDESVRVEADKAIEPLESPQFLGIKLYLSSPSSSDTVYIAEWNGDGWEVIESFQLAPLVSSTTLSFPITYSGEISEEKEYAVLLKESSGKYRGTFFSISIDWGEYEENMISALSPIMWAIIPVSFALLVSFSYSVFHFSRNQIHEVTSRGEYSLSSLFFPFRKKAPLMENFASIFVNPYFWLAELFVILLFIFLIFFTGMIWKNTELSYLIFVISGAVSLIFPFSYAIIMWLIDYLEREPVRFIISLFLWGTLAGFVSLVVNTIFSIFLIIPFGYSATSSVLIGILTSILFAPFIEEFAKGLGVLFFSFHHEFDGMMDGIVYGFLIGVGFSFPENWLYFASNFPPQILGLNQWFLQLGTRSFLSSLGHGFFTAIIGAFIGYFKARKHRLTTLSFIPAFLVASLLHGLFNFLSIMDAIVELSTEFPVPIFTSLLLAFVVVILATSVTIVNKKKKKMRAAEKGGTENKEKSKKRKKRKERESNQEQKAEKKITT